MQSDSDYERDRQTFGANTISLRYGHVVLTGHSPDEVGYQFSTRFTPAEALQMLAWLEQHREELQRAAQSGDESASH